MFQDFFNVLDEQELQEISRSVLWSPRWQFGTMSVSEPRAQPIFFWKLDLDNDVFFTQHMFHKIQELSGQQYRLIRVYANGQTHGQCGTIHVDTLSPDSPPGKFFTFLYYANSKWDIEWGGHTMMILPGMQVFSRYPEPNSAILFDSTFPHCGLEPTVWNPGMRVTIAYKLELLENDSKTSMQFL